MAAHAGDYSVTLLQSDLLSWLTMLIMRFTTTVGVTHQKSRNRDHAGRRRRGWPSRSASDHPV